MKKNLKTMLYALLLLTLAGAAEVAASRYAPASALCHATARNVPGALEMYNMDNDPIQINGVRPVDRELLTPLVKGKYLLNIDYLFELEKKFACRHYLVQADAKAPMMIICRQHGAPEYKERNLSPQEQFNLYCRENGMNPGDYQLDLSSEVHSDMFGSPLMVHVANLWPVFMVLPVVFFVTVVRRRSGTGSLAGAYLFGTCVMAFLLILSLINIYYFSEPVPGFRRFTYGSYPSGANSLSVVTLIGLGIWWLISLLNTIVSVVRKSEFMLPLVFTVLMPLAFFLVESRILMFFDTAVAMSFPLLGALLLYLMATRS
ncbi:MAG: hypothetical protein CVV42_08185 [Candidatus Riflebacteria bacterium HGW-Riflebacteria-2]|jgi:hypothetical protein|nr:MAG: hypothetical protein CVV42_08185 [Candidatus Riflebacteria bacterium HGW-Riflebacteria-2]